MANVIAGLAAQLGLDTTEFKKGVREAIDTLQELKERIPEAISIAGFVEMTKKAMEYSHQIVETAQANDVAIESVMRMSHALEVNGGSAEDVGRIYAGFTQKVEAAAQGNATAQESFARLGVTLNDLRHLSEQDLFEKTVAGLANMKDAAERNGLAFQTLGKSIRGVDIKGLANTLHETKGEFDKYAQAVEDAHLLVEKMQKSWHEFTLEFINNVLPTLNLLYDALHKDSTVMKDAVYWLGEFIKVGAVMAKFTATTVEAIMSDLKTLWDTVKLLATGSFKEIGKLWDEQKKKTDEMIASDWNFFDKLFGEKKAEESIKHIEKVDGANRKVTESFSKQLLNAKGLLDAYERQAKINLDTLKHHEETLNMTRKEKEVQDEVNKVYAERDKALANIQNKMDNLDMTKLGSKEILDELKKQQFEIAVVTDKYVQETKRAVQANQELRESFEYGWNQAYKQFKENAMTAADYGAQAFNTMTNTMDTALANFVKTGKLNFKSLAQSIIQDLLTIQLKMQANQLFSGAMNSVGGFSGLAGAFKSMVGSRVGFQNDAGGWEVAGSLGFADGGDPPVGVASVVGERGPELFVPKTAGTIIPNNQLGNIGGSTTNVTNYNINAIDTKSFEDRLYGSANAIWAANSYAQKNLAVNRSRT